MIAFVPLGTPDTLSGGVDPLPLKMEQTWSAGIVLPSQGPSANEMLNSGRLDDTGLYAAVPVVWNAATKPHAAANAKNFFIIFPLIMNVIDHLFHADFCAQICMILTICNHGCGIVYNKRWRFGTRAAGMRCAGNLWMCANARKAGVFPAFLSLWLVLVFQGVIRDTIPEALPIAPGISSNPKNRSAFTGPGRVRFSTKVR